MTESIDIAASHRARLGCSNIAQALGLSRWGTAYQLWERYTGRAPWPDLGGELRVALGEPMEEVLQPFVEKILGGELRRDRKVYLHPTLPLVAHLDFRINKMAAAVIAALGRPAEVRPILDMKTSLGWGARHRFGADGTDEVDDDVLLQIQGYTMLTGAELAFVAALVPGPEIKVYTIPADPDLHTMIAEGVENFWWHVTSDTPPDITTLCDANRRWRNGQAGLTVAADAAALNALQELRELNARIKELEAVRDRYELALKTALGEAEALLGADGTPICTWKLQPSTRVDVAALKAAGVYETYTKTTTSRVFRLPASKKEKA